MAHTWFYLKNTNHMLIFNIQLLPLLIYFFTRVIKNYVLSRNDLHDIYNGALLVIGCIYEPGDLDLCCMHLVLWICAVCIWWSGSVLYASGVLDLCCMHLVIWICAVCQVRCILFSAFSSSGKQLKANAI